MLKKIWEYVKKNIGRVLWNEKGNFMSKFAASIGVTKLFWKTISSLWQKTNSQSIAWIIFWSFCFKN